MREKLIELIDAVLLYLPWGEVTPHTAADIADRIIDSGICDESKWIPVTERLPEKSGKYIVCSRKNEWEEPNVYQAKFYRYVLLDGGHWGQKDKGKNITHWMPMPEPPEGE